METYELTEKEKNIIAAVIATRGVIKSKAGLNVLKCLITTGRRTEGDYTTGTRENSSTHLEVICTIEEYNQCVEDMEHAVWMHDCSYGYIYKFHLDWCESNNINTSNKALLKEGCDKEPQPFSGDMSTLKHGTEYLDKDGQHCKFIQFYRDDIIGHLFEQPDINNLPCISVSHYADIKPIKTPEQIQKEKELEDAKIKQIDSDCELLSNKGFRVDPVVLRCLQSHGRLAEITLPLDNNNEEV